MTTPDRTPEQRGGGETHPRIPESLGTGNLIWVHPAELMQDNPAALIVNTESYNRIRASFSVDQFDPPQVVRVRAFSPEGEEVIRRFVVDGHTRTKYANDNPNVIVAAFRFESIPVRDVTASQLRSPIVVPEGEQRPDQDALTMVQYLRAVIPPTIEHSQIAPDRIAAHLINGWRNMVGEDVASKFSAIAALSLLENPTVPSATDALLKQFLGRQVEIMAGETKEERAKLEQGLMEMASIVRQTKLFREKVAESAFVLVASGSSVIGGERESLKQIYGLLHVPTVEKKLSDIAKNRGEQEQLRAQLGQLVANTFRRFSGAHNREQIIASLTQVLRDQSINFDAVNEIFNSDTPAEKYDQIRQEMNKQKLQSAYTTTHKTDSLSGTVITLIRNLGGKAYLETREIPAIVLSIRNADELVQRAANFVSTLASKRDDLLSSGVTEETIHDSLEVLNKTRGALLESNSLQAIALRARELTTVLTEAERKINRGIAVRKTGLVVDELFNGTLQTGYGPQIRTNIITYVLREVDPTNEISVRRLLDQLKGLDTDLQSRVIIGDIRIAAATRIQAQRKIGVQTPSTLGPLGRTIQAPGRETKGSAIQNPPTRVTSTPRTEDTPIDRKTVEEKRKLVNNERLVQAVRALRQVLGNLDLESNEVTTESQRELDQMLKELGKLRFSHPDIVRALEDYQRHLQRETKIRETQVQQDIEDSQRDTRTRR